MGMTFDKAGRIYVSTNAGLQMFDPTGRLGGVIDTPHYFTANTVFGGTDFTWLYIAGFDKGGGDKIYRRKMKSPGAPYILRAKKR